MPSYTRINFLQGSSPPINATNLNKMDAQCAAVQYGFNVIGGPGTPNGFQLCNNVSISSGSTYVVTCTGVGGIPTGTIALRIFGFFTPSASGMQLNFFPHGSTPSSPQVIPPTTAVTSIGIEVYLDSTGKLDLYAASGNVSGLYLYAGSYIY